MARRAGHGARRDREIRLVGHLTVFHDVGDDGLDIADGDGKADALDGRAGIGGAGILGGGDADDLAVEVKECAAGVAGVYGAVGLDEVHGRAGGEGWICDRVSY